MQRGASASSDDQGASSTAFKKTESWATSALGSATAACCYTVEKDSDDDYYQPASLHNTKLEDCEPINAELGLTEDHFSRPEGFFGLSTIEELEIAIENCKEMIMDTPEKTDKRKQLVKKLVQLRLKYEEEKEGPPKSRNIVSGHLLLPGSVDKLQHYCEKCCGVIWSVFHNWYQCKYCGFKCHNKCINLIRRVCAHSKVLENPQYILDICPEISLSEQKYRCAECKRKFVFKDGECLPRLCEYNGKNYCSFCHWNSQAIIPARVVHNWDFSTRKICRASSQFLRLMMKKPVLNLESLNPTLFNYVEELCTVKKLRQDILLMKQYFLSCHAALEEKLLLQLQYRQHFVETADTYCLQDLIDIISGQLLEFLQTVHCSFTQHITEKCQGCRGKGFICEFCKSDEILFPFYTQIDSCANCNSLFHPECSARGNAQCPKCVRRAKVNSNTDEGSLALCM